MANLIDSNCFIQAKNTYYGFDFCPGYWKWIEEQHQSGIIFSIDRVATELAEVQDELTVWAATKNSSFFLPTNTDVVTIGFYQQIAAWASNADFKAQAIPEFLRGADPFLIAHALAHGHTVVSHELMPNPNQRNKIKIPIVCQHFGVPCISIFDLIRSTNARFDLQP